MSDTPSVGFASVGIAVGLPFGNRPTHPLWGVALASQVYPLNTSTTHIVMQNVEVGEARNAIVEHALNIKARYLWFIDDDVIVPPYAGQRLGYALDTRGPELYPEAKVAVVGGIYMSKEELSTPVVYKRNGRGATWDWKVGGIFDVESIGTGCMMIDTNVFSHLEKPYFKTVEGYVQNEDGTVGVQKMTDDIYFCQKVKAAGFNILAHGGVLCGHYDVKKNHIFTLPEDSYPVKAAKEEEVKKQAETQPA